MVPIYQRVRSHLIACVLAFISKGGLLELFAYHKITGTDAIYLSSTKLQQNRNHVIELHCNVALMPWLHGGASLEIDALLTPLIP